MTAFIVAFGNAVNRWLESARKHFQLTIPVIALCLGEMAIWNNYQLASMLFIFCQIPPFCALYLVPLYLVLELTREQLIYCWVWAVHLAMLVLMPAAMWEHQVPPITMEHLFVRLAPELANGMQISTTYASILLFIGYLGTLPLTAWLAYDFAKPKEKK